MSGELLGPSSRRRSVGRPRAFTLDQVLDAAQEIGLDKLTMADVAKHLGVAVAVLYNYVSSREELIRFTAQRASKWIGLPDDTGQSWREIAIDYAETVFKVVANDPALIAMIANGELGPHLKTDTIEQWLAMLTRRGFSVSDALGLYRAIDVVLCGGALLGTHVRAMGEKGQAYESQIRSSVTERPKEDLPILSSNFDIYVATSDPSQWRLTLEILLDGFELRQQKHKSLR